MKKFIVIALALFLVLPALSYAGSMTSRWDVTFGGYVKFDVGWMSQGQGIDYRAAGRESISLSKSQVDEYAVTNWYSGETRFNFAIKGPAAWNGAKTSAFIEGDFRGVAGSRATATGLFTLRHAFMDFKWANTTLLLGHTWQPWGLIPSFNMLAFSENHFMKGATRVPQVRVTQKLNKEFSAQLAIASPNQVLWGNNGGNYIDDKNRALMPDTSLDIKYATDKCGKIGPWMLTFGLGGMWGKEKVTWQENAVWTLPGSKNIDRWGASFYGYIPIIPEKKGNKTNALGFTWNAFSGQGVGAMLPAYPGTPYNRGADAVYTGLGLTNTGVNNDPMYATTSGAWAQLTYYYTDSVSSNVLWGYQSNNLSQQYELANPAATRNLQNFVINIMYNVNPAVRFGLEYTRITTSYGYWIAPARATGAGSQPKGSLDAIRFGAFYFF